MCWVGACYFGMLALFVLLDLLALDWLGWGDEIKFLDGFWFGDVASCGVVGLWVSCGCAVVVLLSPYVC